MAVKDVMHDSDQKMKKTIESVSRELSSVRTDRASAGLLDHVKVDYFGAQTPLKQLANISAPEPRLIVINPWDKSSIVEIEKALLKSDIGITPANDGKVLRLTMPQLTEERRDELSKVVAMIAEEGKVSLRSIRHTANENLKKMLDSSEVSKDDGFRGKEDIQKLTDKFSGDIDKLLEAKQKEIKSI